MAPTQSSSATILVYTALFALFACSVTTVDAIRCHQCNSHLDEDCNSLTLNIPRAIRDEQYLSDCEVQEDVQRVFCRKTVTTIAVSNEKRIVRGCGWHVEDLRGRNDTCITADNEGFFEEICACFEDGCNSAPMSLKATSKVLILSTIFVLVMAAVRHG